MKIEQLAGVSLNGREPIYTLQAERLISIDGIPFIWATVTSSYFIDLFCLVADDFC